jgi:RecB family exonuclease
MPFGLCNTPTTFQRMMNDTMPNILHKIVTAYVDGICVNSRTLDEHLNLDEFPASCA